MIPAVWIATNIKSLEWKSLRLGRRYWHNSTLEHCNRTNWRGEKGCYVLLGFPRSELKDTVSWPCCEFWRVLRKWRQVMGWCYSSHCVWSDGALRERKQGTYFKYKTALNIAAQAEVFNNADVRMRYVIYIYFFAHLIPCQRRHHPSTDEQRSW